jgi:GNAT superfamily N-acetyltransferase
MLYEAVFWRDSVNKPSFEEGLAYPEVSKAIANWDERDGDIAVVALDDLNPAWATWYIFYSDNYFIRGYMPTLVISAHRDFRRHGIGEALVGWQIDRASRQNIQKISLVVSKDNHVINIGRECGFMEYADKGDSLLMLRKI